MNWLQRSFISIVSVLVVASGAPIASAQSDALSAPALPVAAAAGTMTLKPRGGGLLRVFGFRVYNAYLWTPDGASFDPRKPYALDIEYLRNFEGRALAEQSIKEMRSQEIGSDAVYPKWVAEMTRVFPNVKPNDRLTGVATAERTAKFFYNGALAGEIRDPEFVDAFFGIWLNEKSSQPRFRERLLGNKQ